MVKASRPRKPTMHYNSNLQRFCAEAEHRQQSIGSCSLSRRLWRVLSAASARVVP